MTASISLRIRYYINISHFFAKVNMKNKIFPFSQNFFQKAIDKRIFFCYNYIRCNQTTFAAMAQQVEHVLGKDEVTGSNPVSSSRKGLYLRKVLFPFAFRIKSSKAIPRFRSVRITLGSSIAVLLSFLLYSEQPANRNL